MNKWITGIIYIFSALLVAALLSFFTGQPRGEPIALQPPPTQAPFVVHVTGAVAAPGVYALPPGSRVRDALEAAGGLLTHANPEGLNLAARLSDGAQINVATLPPTPAADANPPDTSDPPADKDPSTVTTPAPPTETPAPSDDLININTGAQADLETLNGVGPATALKIIAYREENGPFATIEDIVNVSGIGPATFEKIKDFITVGP